MLDVVLGNTWLSSAGPVSTDKRDTSTKMSTKMLVNQDQPSPMPPINSYPATPPPPPSKSDLH